MWDTAGEEGYARLRTLSYPKTDLVFLCFSVVNPTSFNSTQDRWMKEIATHNPKHSGIILLGTKIDLRDDVDTLNMLSKEGKTPISYQEGQKLAEEIGAIGYLECSSLTGENVNSVIDEALRFCVYKKYNYNDPSFSVNNYSLSLPISRAKSARK